MKKIFYILSLFLVILSSSANSGPIGTGELTLSESSVKWFIKYVRGGHGKKPLKFLITTDGMWPHYWFCPAATCTPGGDDAEIRVCELKTKRECKVFARSRTIKWKNGINKGNRKSKFNSKWSDAEIIAKLTELGFLENTTQKIEKIQTSQTNDTSDITKQLTNLIEMYESGSITKEEFEKAKKKLLD